jgi:hypothetical protein
MDSLIWGLRTATLPAIERESVESLRFVTLDTALLSAPLAAAS